MLTEAKVRSFTATDAGKHPDIDGLYLFVTPTGAKSWRYNFRFGGKQLTKTYGCYPLVLLIDARQKHLAARKLLDHGINPIEAGKAAQTTEPAASDVTLLAVAKAWYEQRETIAPSSSIRDTSVLTKHIYPAFGARPIESITVSDMSEFLRGLKAQDLSETVRRAQQLITKIFQHWMGDKRCTLKSNPARELEGMITTRASNHYATITDPRKIGALLRAIDGYDGDATTRHALRLLPYVFVRPGELRHAKWSEFDLDGADGAIWRVPKFRMKKRVEHFVPLSRQAVAIIKELQPLTGRGEYVFSGARSVDRPISNGTLNAALRRMGYRSDEIVAHGFRGMASTQLNELDFDDDWIERQLAHVEQDGVRAAYNHAKHLTKRRGMMQAWADYLDGLRGRKPTLVKAS